MHVRTPFKPFGAFLGDGGTRMGGGGATPPWGGNPERIEGCCRPRAAGGWTKGVGFENWG